MRIATFKGKHNISKSKVLLILNSASTERWPRVSLTARELSALSGLSIAATKSLLWRLLRWHYVISVGIHNDMGYDSRRYAIGVRGTNFIPYIPTRVMAELMPELQATINKNINKIHWR